MLEEYSNPVEGEDVFVDVVEAAAFGLTEIQRAFDNYPHDEQLRVLFHEAYDELVRLSDMHDRPHRIEEWYKEQAVYYKEIGNRQGVNQALHIREQIIYHRQKTTLSENLRPSG